MDAKMDQSACVLPAGCVYGDDCAHSGACAERHAIATRYAAEVMTALEDPSPQWRDNPDDPEDPICTICGFGQLVHEDDGCVGPCTRCPDSGALDGQRVGS